MRKGFGKPMMTVCASAFALMAQTSWAAAQSAEVSTSPSGLMPVMAAPTGATAGDTPTTQRNGRMVEYLGGGYLTLSSECEEYGWAGTHPIMMRLQPQGQGSNDPNISQMALYFPTGTIALTYNIDETDRYSGIDPEIVTYIWNGPWVPEDPIMSLGFNARYGSSISSGDENLISLFVYFQNFNEHPGCVANTRVSVGRI